jgi:TRAP-type transport system periplasmic protein
MKKRILCSIISTFLCLICFFAFTSVGFAAKKSEKVITLNLAHYLPESVTEWTAWDTYFVQEVERRTDGRVKIIVHWSESLGKIPDLPRLCSSGAVDMMATTPGYSPTWFRLTSVINQIPFIQNSLEEVMTVAKKLYFEGPLPEVDYKKNNMKLLFVDCFREYHTFTKKPFETLEEIKGKKIRTWGPYLPRAIAAAGAVPVDVAPSEMFESLQRGRVDGIPWGINSAYGAGLHEIAPYVCMTGIGLTPGVIRLINLDVWNKLPPDIQKIMEEVSQELMGEVGLNIANSHYEKAHKLLSQSGATFVEFKDRGKWIETMPDFRKEWVNEMQGTAIADEAKQLYEMWNEALGK